LVVVVCGGVWGGVEGGVGGGWLGGVGCWGFPLNYQFSLADISSF